MSEPFIAEVRMWGCSFAPRGWAFCHGGLIPISENTALFSLIGTTYGGDGRSTFALPDLSDRAPMHPGKGPGLTYRRLGENGGFTGISLNENEIPSHEHTMYGAAEKGNQKAPDTTLFLAQDGESRAEVGYYLSTNGEIDSSLSSSGLRLSGGSLAHNNIQPLLGVNFCIALIGVYPTRS